MNIDSLLQTLIERKGSDLHLKVGRPPLLRISGRIVPTEFERVNPEMIKELVYPIMNHYQIQKFEENWEIDFSYSLKDLARFRVNLFYQKGTIAGIFRMIPYKIPSIDELSLPPVLKDLSTKPQGLILVTGPTGCGKTTTLAAMINYINETRECHIITVEDPIEFVYRDNRSEINQREIGSDTKSFAEALKHILRQDPDVILVGEMRDLETISTAVTAAETGHLVFSTLHTNDAKQTIDRVIDSFPSHQQQQIRLQLAATLQGVISQRLLRRADGGGRVAAVEVMINSPTVKKLIEEGNTSSITKAIESSVTYYRMQTLNQALVKLVQDGIVTEEEALSVTPNPDELKLNLKGIFTGSSIDRSATQSFYDT